MPDLPCFIADVMLGSLAKWLRLMGFDTLYFNDIEDSELIRLARQQQRVLITRDSKLAQQCRKGLGGHPVCVRIMSDVLAEQAREVCAAIPDLRFPDNIASRCARCNGEIAVVDRNTVSEYIPGHVLLAHPTFFSCKDCYKIYWHGSHKERIDRMISKVLKK